MLSTTKADCSDCCRGAGPGCECIMLSYTKAVLWSTSPPNRPPWWINSALLGVGESKLAPAGGDDAATLAACRPTKRLGCLDCTETEPAEELAFEPSNGSFCTKEVAGDNNEKVAPPLDALVCLSTGTSLGAKSGLPEWVLENDAVAGSRSRLDSAASSSSSNALEAGPKGVCGLGEEPADGMDRRPVKLLCLFKPCAPKVNTDTFLLSSGEAVLLWEESKEPLPGLSSIFKDREREK